MRKSVLFDEKTIVNRVKEVADEINGEYGGKPIVAIPLLRGGIMFATDLIRNLKCPVEVDFLTTSSYGFSDTSSGNVNILTDLRTDIEGKDVLIIDDIIDTGKTLFKVRDFLKTKNPNSIKICTMLDKPSRRDADISVDFCGFEVDDLFIVGYGLDYKNFYRNIPYIFVFEEDDNDE